MLLKKGELTYTPLCRMTKSKPPSVDTAGVAERETLTPHPLKTRG